LRPYSSASSRTRCDHALRVGEGPAAGSLAQGDVLRHGEGGHEHEVLVYHPDPGAYRVGGGSEGAGKAVYEYLALVGLVHAVELPHEGALAGAVLAEEGVDLPRRDVEADLGIGEDAGEALGDVAHLYPAGLDLGQACSARNHCVLS
jgi:hypothetical protein